MTQELQQYLEAKNTLIRKQVLTEDEKKWNKSVELGLQILRKDMLKDKTSLN